MSYSLVTAKWTWNKARSSSSSSSSSWSGLGSTGQWTSCHISTIPSCTAKWPTRSFGSLHGNLTDSFLPSFSYVSQVHFFKMIISLIGIFWFCSTSISSAGATLFWSREGRLLSGWEALQVRNREERERGLARWILHHLEFCLCQSRPIFSELSAK